MCSEETSQKESGPLLQNLIQEIALCIIIVYR